MYQSIYKDTLESGGISTVLTGNTGFLYQISIACDDQADGTIQILHTLEDDTPENPVDFEQSASFSNRYAVLPVFDLTDPTTVLQSVAAVSDTYKVLTLNCDFTNKFVISCAGLNSGSVAINVLVATPN